MIYKKFALISLFGLLLTVLAPLSVLAHVSVDTNENNYAPDIDEWTEYGDADILSDDRVKITMDNDLNGHVYTDVDIPSGHDDYAVYVSFTRAEKPYANLYNGGENIAGLPVLYAYFLDDDGDIVEYVQETSMRQKASDGRRWHVSYGIVEVPDDSEAMRLFLQQASRSGVTPDGRAAWFYKPGLYFVDSTHDAEDVVDAYLEELDEVEEMFGPQRYDYSSDSDNDDNDSDNNDDEPDYPVGTLLKCSNEPEVYSMTSSNTLKLFPDEETFYAWGHSFAEVKTISCSKLDDYDVSGTWTYERADYLVKFHDQPAVFTLDNDIYLRLIPDEYTARQTYGSHWTSLIHEYPVSEMDEYSYGVPHRSLR